MADGITVTLQSLLLFLYIIVYVMYTLYLMLFKLPTKKASGYRTPVLIILLRSS